MFPNVLNKNISRLCADFIEEVCLYVCVCVCVHAQF